MFRAYSGSILCTLNFQSYNLIVGAHSALIRTAHCLSCSCVRYVEPTKSVWRTGVFLRTGASSKLHICDWNSEARTTQTVLYALAKVFRKWKFDAANGAAMSITHFTAATVPLMRPEILTRQARDSLKPSSAHWHDATNCLQIEVWGKLYLPLCDN